MNHFLIDIICVLKAFIKQTVYLYSLKYDFHHVKSNNFSGIGYGFLAIFMTNCHKTIFLTNQFT